MTHTQHYGDATRRSVVLLLIVFVSVIILVLLGCRSTHLTEDRLENGKTGVDDANERFEGGEYSNFGERRFRVTGGVRHYHIDSKECETADPKIHM